MLRVVLFVSLLFIGSAASAQFHLDMTAAPYASLAGLDGVGNGSTEGERMGAIRNATSYYQVYVAHNATVPPAGTIVQLTYSDGSRERCEMKSHLQGLTCVIVAGTFSPPSGQSAGFGSYGIGWYYWGGTVWRFGYVADVSVHYGEVGVPYTPPDDTDEP